MRKKDDFAPRLGVAWQPLPNLVLRAGAGIFYDLGYSSVANGPTAFPFSRAKTILKYFIPAERCRYRVASFYGFPVSYLAVVDPNHLLPRTYEVEPGGGKDFGKGLCRRSHLPRRGGPKADAGGPLHFKGTSCVCYRFSSVA
jgi:hypothetical protein